MAPSAFSKKPPKQVVRKQNLALPSVQDIQTMWEYRFRKASGTTLKDKASSESWSQGHFLVFERPDMIYYTTSPHIIVRSWTPHIVSSRFQNSSKFVKNSTHFERISQQKQRWRPPRGSSGHANKRGDSSC